MIDRRFNNLKCNLFYFKYIFIYFSKRRTAQVSNYIYNLYLNIIWNKKIVDSPVNYLKELFITPP